MFLPWEQTVKGEGTVIAYDPTERDYSLGATMDGFIDAYYVQENEFVKKGTKLFTMVDLDKNYLNRLQSIESGSRDQYKNSKLQVSNFEQKKANLKEYLEIGMNVFQQKLDQTKNKIKNLQLQKISLEKNYQVQKANFLRTKALHEDGIESQRNLETREHLYIKSKAEFEKISVDIQMEKNNLDIIKNERQQFLKETENKQRLLENAALSSANLVHSLKQDVQRHAANVSRYNTGEVYAQKDGYVVKIFQNDKNKFIKKGDKVIHFSPKVSTKSLRLKVSDFNMPLIKEGLPVRIMFYGWPALQVSGWPKIGFGSFGGIIKKVEDISHEKGSYYALVVEDPKEPWPQGDDLRIGTQSSVWVRLSSVPIWYQLWRMMNAIPPKMVTPSIEKK